MKAAFALMLVLAVGLCQAGETWDSTVNWFTDLHNDLVEVGNAIAEVAVSTTKTLVSQGAQAVAGAVITTMPDRMVNRIFGKRSDNAKDLLSSQGYALDSIMLSALSSLEQMNAKLSADLPNISIEDFNAKVDSITARNERGVRSVLGVVKATTTVVSLATKVFGDEDVARREIRLTNFQGIRNSVETLFNRNADVVVSIVQGAADALKSYASDVTSAVKDAAVDVKGKLVAIETRFDHKSAIISQNAKALQANFKTFSENLVQAAAGKI